MNITDEELAKIVGKTLSQIESIKKNNKKEYNILKSGALCKKFELNEEDIKKRYTQKI